MLEPPRHRHRILKGKLRKVLEGLSWLHVWRVECTPEVYRGGIQQTTRESTMRLNEYRLTGMIKRSIKQKIKQWQSQCKN